MSEEETCNLLIADGWREYPDQFRKESRCFYKRFDTPTRCFGNSDKNGIQIQCSVSQFREFVSYELEIVAGLSDETWFTLHNYSLPKDVRDGLKLIPRMLNAWETVANYAQPSDPDAHIVDQEDYLAAKQKRVKDSGAWTEQDLKDFEG